MSEMNILKSQLIVTNYCGFDKIDDTFVETIKIDATFDINTGVVKVERHHHVGENTLNEHIDIFVDDVQFSIYPDYFYQNKLCSLSFSEIRKNIYDFEIILSSDAIRIKNFNLYNALMKYKLDINLQTNFDKKNTIIKI